MAKDNVCVFCGQTLRGFRPIPIACSGTTQTACRSCANELSGSDQVERCRRALVHDLADQPEVLREYLEIVSGAEAHRPQCLACGGKLRFRARERLDNTIYRDSIFSTGFTLQPACCPDCGRYAFFDPKIVGQNPFLAHLMQKDTANT